MTTDASNKAAGILRDRASGGADPTSALDRELWVRRHNRRELELINTMPEEIRPLAPLVLALARLAAQRDVKATAEHHAGAEG